MVHVTRLRDQWAVILPIHYDVPGHAIRLETLTETTDAAVRVSHAFADALSANAPQFDVFVLPPAEGSYLARLAYVFAGFAAFAQFMDSDLAKGPVQVWTGYEPRHWYDEAAKAIQNALSSVRDISHRSGDFIKPDADCVRTGLIIVESIKRFLLGSDIEADDAPARRIPEAAYNARARFYNACVQDNDIRGIGFTENPGFPIDRAGFERLQNPRQPDEPVWETEIAEVRTTSPNWNRRDQRRRGWKGHAEGHGDIVFTIDDEGFWLRAGSNELPLRGTDTLKVQWAFQRIAGRPRNHKVLRVLTYNGQNLAKPLDDDALTAILGSFRQAPADNSQLNLFDTLRPEGPTS